MADFILGAIPENDTSQDQATDQAAVLPAASSRAASDPPTSVYASKTKSQALELQKTQPQALCFPTDDDNIIFNGKEWGVKPIIFEGITNLRSSSTSDQIKTALGITSTNTWEVLRRKIANGYPVCSVSGNNQVNLLAEVYDNYLNIIWFEVSDLYINYISILYTPSSKTFHVNGNVNYILTDLLTRDNVVDEFYTDDPSAPLSSSRGTWLMNNKAGVITAHGLLMATGGLSGQINVNVTSAFGFPFSELVERISNEGCTFISDADMENALFTSGTLQYLESEGRVMVFFDIFFFEGTPVKKVLILERAGSYPNDIICRNVYTCPYQCV